MTELIRYEAACRAISDALAIDEVKDIRDKSEAVRMYAVQANNRALQIQCAEIRFRAERRIGELKRAMRAAGVLHEGGRPKTSATAAEVSKVKLSDLGVDEKLSIRSEKLASIEPNAFERLLTRWREHQDKEVGRVSVSLIKEDDEARRREENANRQYTGGKVDDLKTLIDAGRKFSAIVADPPWHFVTRSEKGDGRSAAKHYVTDFGNDMFKLPVAQLAADDCVLFLWVVDWAPMLALDLIKAWGFEHKTTAFTWAKQNASSEGFHMGQGYWTRANPEDCWLATRGHPTRLNRDVRQLVVAPVMEHSRKPEIIHSHIERLVGGPYLELYARRPRDKWQTWGNELAFKIALADTPPHDPETGEIIEEEGKPAEESRRAMRPSTGKRARVLDDEERAPAKNEISKAAVPEEKPAGELTASGRVHSPTGEHLDGGDVSVEGAQPTNEKPAVPVPVERPSEPAAGRGENDLPTPQRASTVGEPPVDRANGSNATASRAVPDSTPAGKPSLASDLPAGERGPRSLAPKELSTVLADDLAIPDSLRRIELTKEEWEWMDSVDIVANLALNERQHIKKLRSDPDRATVLDRKYLRKIAEKYGLTNEVAA